jgi:GPH family glycoside/pentoside/hexuronide:cation symporter
MKQIVDDVDDVGAVNAKPDKVGMAEMLSFGGARFASSIFMAFSTYYLLAFYTDVALMPAAATAALLMGLRLFSAADGHILGLFMNRATFKNGKYRPYFKWCALPFALSLAGLGLMPETGMAVKIAYAAVMLLICEVSWSALNLAALSLIPIITTGDLARTKFASFSNGSSIMAYIVVGTFMMPLVAFLGGGDKQAGFSLTLLLFAAIAALLTLNAYFRLRERHYTAHTIQPTVRDMFLSIARNRRIMLFMAGFLLYAMADSCKSQLTYYFMANNLNRMDLLPVFIMASLLASFATQPFIPQLLSFARKELLIVAGLFAASGTCLLMLAAAANPYALIACSMLYGIFTAITANLVFTVLASFADEIRERQNMHLNEILVATLGLSSKIGAAIASGAAPLTLAAFGYKAQAAVQPASALIGIKTLFLICPAIGMALAGLVMFFSGQKTIH